MSCRKYVDYMSYQNALCQAISDKIVCCYWIRHVVHFLISSSLWIYHYSLLCYEYAVVAGQVEDAMFDMNPDTADTIKYTETIVLIPHAIIFSLGKLKTLGFASVMSLIYFVICTFNF